MSREPYADWWDTYDAKRARDKRQRELLAHYGPIRRWLCNHGHHNFGGSTWPFGYRWCVRCQTRWPR